MLVMVPSGWMTTRLVWKGSAAVPSPVTLDWAAVPSAPTCPFPYVWPGWVVLVVVSSGWMTTRVVWKGFSAVPSPVTLVWAMVPSAPTCIPPNGAPVTLMVLMTTMLVGSIVTGTLTVWVKPYPSVMAMSKLSVFWSGWV